MFNDDKFENENINNESGSFFNEIKREEAVKDETIIEDSTISEKEEAKKIYQDRAPYEPIKDSYYREAYNSNKKKPMGFKKILALCLVISLFGGAGLGGGYAAVNSIISNNKDFASDVPQEIVPPSVTENAAENKEVIKPHYNDNKVTPISTANNAVDVINHVFPSIVNITIGVTGSANYWGMIIPYESEGAGSGVIFDEDDEYVYIVTNNHVVGDANTISISVTGIESIPASIVGTDASNDLAVIKALKEDFKKSEVAYSIASFGNSDNLNVGESVIAIGNALGEGKSATGGMISILNKSLEIDGIHLTVIQTSAPINPGNSGGALVNYNGEVIGINTAKVNASVAEGVGYAIPSNTVIEIMNRLEEEGTQPKPYIGIMGSDITDDISELYKLPIGVLVRQVLDESPADEGGLKEGDIITAIDDYTVMNMDSLINILSEMDIGHEAELNVIRNNKAITVKIIVADANSISE